MLILQLATGAALASDTVLVRAVPPIRTTFEQIVFVASGLTSILALCLCLLAVLSLLAMRKGAAMLQAEVTKLLVELRPLAQEAAAAAKEVRQVATQVQEMVADSKTTVTTVNSTVRASMESLGERVQEVSETVGRVTRLAEGIATAAAGAAGAAAGFMFGGRRARRRRDPRPDDGPEGEDPERDVGEDEADETP